MLPGIQGGVCVGRGGSIIWHSENVPTELGCGEGSEDEVRMKGLAAGGQ
jgi:hypothetical protein